MEARVQTINQVLVSGDKYLIPFFQRSYKWGPKNWDRLVEDIESLLTDQKRQQPFLGPLVCTPNEQGSGEARAFQLIDGQQRLTTLTLLLTALRDLSRERGLVELSEEV